MKKSLLFSSLLFSAWSFAIVGFMGEGESPVFKAPSDDAVVAVSVAESITTPVAATVLTDENFPIAAGSVWKYNDTGSDLGTAWREVSFDDTAWASGAGKLGYSDNPVTTLSYGPDSNDKYPTYYFRYEFTVTEVAADNNLLFNLLVDDGAVVYVNGTEVIRTNMPAGEVTYNTWASSQVGGASESTYSEFIVANMLVTGTNVIAVEVHQGAANSSDMGFDLTLEYQEVQEPAEVSSVFPVSKDSGWYYLDNGTSLDAENWGETSYDVSAWATGYAPLGYGDPTKTIISYGPDANNKFITSYFVKDVEINMAELSDLIEFGIRRDDAAVVYVNGVEIFRENMPEGDFDYLTHSATIIDSEDEKRFWVHTVPNTVFQEGTNRIAVEIHNRDGQSSDLGFDMYVKNREDLSLSCDEPHIGCFTSIMPTAQTPQMIIPADHRFQLMFKQGDEYTDGSGTVPGNNDFTGYIPAGGSSVLGHVSVNQENTPGGVSMLDVHFDETTNLWSMDASKRVDLYNEDLVTTTRNCSGGVTPWGTVISAEESTNSGDANNDGYEDVGWLVEIDPATASVMEYGNGKQEKLWAMGRMNHENVVVSADGTTAYYGEDGGTHCVYKFVADTPNDLTAGTVYVLKLDLGLSNDEPNCSTAEWIQVPNTTQQDRNNLNSVAGALGGTNFNGVEDVEIHPINGMIYFAAKGRDRVYRFRDNGNDVTEFETFVGGMSYEITTNEGVYTEPWSDGNDNLAFDDRGNLWVVQDGGLNYIWVVRPDHKQSNPNVLLHSSMPAGAEPTGLTFTPDYKYGWYSVQHPSNNNTAQLDATFEEVTFNKSATVVFALKENLGLQAPTADFIANTVTVAEGTSVTFTDLSTNTPTSWLWTFEGGNPATSEEASPVVTYETAGTYNVSLVTGNMAGISAEEAKVDYITVEPAAGLEDQIGLGKNINIYPNPTSGIVTIELAGYAAGKEVSVNVFDTTGRKLNNVAQTATGNKVNFDLSQYAGQQVFIIQVAVDGKTGSYKLVKTN